MALFMSLTANPDATAPTVYQPKVTTAEAIATESSAEGTYGVQLQGYPYGLGMAGLGATGFPGIAVSTTAIRQGPTSTAKVIGSLKQGTRVTISAIKIPYSQLSSGGWVDSRFVTDDPNALPSDGVKALQEALTQLAALGYNTDPKETNGIVGFGTINALAAALGVVAGDLKGGQTTALALQAALSAALISHSVDTRARDAVRTAAKPLAIAVQIYLAKKRGAAGGIYTGELPGMGPTWTPMTVGLVALGGIVVLGGLYLLVKK